MLAFAMRSSPAPVSFLGSVNCTGIASRVLHFSLEPPRDHMLEPCFVAPLFSWSYELLFPQPLCIHNDLRCPGGVPFGAAPAPELSRRIGSKRVHSISYALFGVPKKPISAVSITYILFLQDTRGGGTSVPSVEEFFGAPGCVAASQRGLGAPHPTIIACKIQVPGPWMKLPNSRHSLLWATLIPFPASLFVSYPEQANTLALLYEVSREITSILDREELLRRVAQRVKKTR